MSNVTEKAQWEDNVYLIDEDDPVVGGPDGIDNIPHQQLANRTAYLKAQQEQLQADVETVGVEGQNALWSGLEYAIADIGLLTKELHRQQFQRHQEGRCVLYNRGIRSGCALSKSTTASRNIGLAAGEIFLRGQIMPVAAQDNAAAVPSNHGDASATAYAYIFLDSNQVKLACTDLDSPAPDDALVLAELAIPAGNDSSTDQHLDQVHITETARVEPEWPGVQQSPANLQHDLTRVMETDAYEITFDVLAYHGGEPPRIEAPESARAANSFRAYLHGSADAVAVRYVTHLMAQ